MTTQLEPLRLHVANRPASAGRGADSPVLVLGSGKGGTGTSTLAALLGVGIAGMGARVLLVDGSVGLGSLHLLLGVEGGPGWGVLRGGDVALDDLLVSVSETLTLLPGGVVEEVGSGGLSAAERQALFRRVASLYGRFDMVVVDGGSRLDSVLAACTPGIGRLLAVSTPDRVSMAATYALVKVLEGKLPGSPIEVLINRGEEAAADNLRAAVRRFLNRTIEKVGAVPDDECLRAGINAGMNVQDAAVGSPAEDAILKIGRQLLRDFSAGHSVRAGSLHLQRRS